MAGDPANAALWVDADVYVGPTTAAIPADVDTAFSGDWDLVGLLDGEAGFPQTRDEEVNDFFAWGGILMRTSRRNFKLTIGFTAFEYNDVTRELIWPGSDPGEIVVPTVVRRRIAFETREGDVVHRLISFHEAEVWVDGEINPNESAVTSYPFVATIYPDGDGVLFTEQETASS